MLSDSIIGVDEVGRGSIAGPLVVAAMVGPRHSFLWRGIRDSKRLSEKQREEWFGRLSEARSRGLVDWNISFVSPQVIDQIGITQAAYVCVGRALGRIECDVNKTQVLLDAGLRAPGRFVNQASIVRGDEKEKLIAAASIVAKVVRDRRMRKYAERFPEYGFGEHKGYGTHGHFCALKQVGVCRLHRMSFLKDRVT